MFLPIGDSPNLPKTPFVTYGLIAANVIVFALTYPQQWSSADLADPAALQYVETLVREERVPLGQAAAFARQLTSYDLLIFRHGFRPEDPSLVDALVAMFLHGGWMHLIGNMLFLWIYGDNVEHRLGAAGYLAVYVLTGLAATAGDGLLRFGSGVPSVGASGAISGVLGLYFAWFPRNRVRVWVFLFPLFADVIELPARLVLGFYLVFDNLFPLLFAGGVGGVSYGAHIGGFLAGWGVAVPLARLLDARGASEFRAQEAAPGSDVSRAFREALDAGRLEEAAALLFGGRRRIGKRKIGLADKLRLGRALERAGHAKAALAAYQRALADHPRDPGLGAAHLGAARVLSASFGFPAAAYQHLYAVLESDPAPHEEQEARALLAALRRTSAHVPRDGAR